MATVQTLFCTFPIQFGKMYGREGVLSLLFIGSAGNVRIYKGTQRNFQEC